MHLEVTPFLSPFSEQIMNGHRPQKVKMPNLELYDGTKDPREHLGVYKAQMYIRDVDDLAYCMYFSATLKGWHKSDSVAYLLGSSHASKSCATAL